MQQSTEEKVSLRNSMTAHREPKIPPPIKPRVYRNQVINIRQSLPKRNNSQEDIDCDSINIDPDMKFGLPNTETINSKESTEQQAVR
jgi:hypothetical protein